MTEESPRKKLSISGARRSESSASSDKERVRTGARARAVAINRLQAPRPDADKQERRSERSVDERRGPRGDRSERSFDERRSPRGDRSGRSFDERRSPRGDRSERSFDERRSPRGDRPERSFDERRGPRSDRPTRSERSVRSDSSAHQQEQPGFSKHSDNKPRSVGRTAGYAKHRPSLSERLDRGAKAIAATPSYASRSYYDDTFNLFASCPIGIEEALAQELKNLGFQDIQAGRSGVRLRTNWQGVMRANLYSRLAIRILVQVAHAPVSTEDDIYELARQVHWERWFGAEQTLRVDTSAIRSPMQSLQFCNLRAKDGIVDRLRELEGERPSIDTVRPDAKVHLFLDSETATLYLDTSGESLFKRGWRFSKGQAPLRENLAAGILHLAGWDPSQALYDPFCGSGTILIEAAWMAQKVPPGIMRPFSFERLRGFQRNQWLSLKEEAYDNILEDLETPIFGSDIDPQVIQAAQDNLARAQLSPSSIRFENIDALKIKAPSSTGFLISNPPYGERLGEQDLEFWREWSSVLKNEFANWQVHLITNDLELPKKLRLKPRRRTPVFNGDIECRLFGFEMVSDSYRDKS